VIKSQWKCSRSRPDIFNALQYERDDRVALNLISVLVQYLVRVLAQPRIPNTAGIFKHKTNYGTVDI